MESLYYWALLVFFVASCQKKTDPVPTLVGGMWSLQTQAVTYTPKAGGPVTTRPRPIAAGSITYAYGADGRFSTVNFGVVSAGRYTYANGLITIPPGSALGHLFAVT